MSQEIRIVIKDKQEEDNFFDAIHCCLACIQEEFEIRGYDLVLEYPSEAE